MRECCPHAPISLVVRLRVVAPWFWLESASDGVVFNPKTSIFSGVVTDLNLYSKAKPQRVDENPNINRV